MKETKGFTITELLVVIATVGMLSVVLLPALVSAKVKAAEETCASNLKQVGLALQMYSQDHEGYIAKSLSGREWSQVLVDGNYLSTPQAFFCPSLAPGDKAIPAINKYSRLPDGRTAVNAQCTYGMFNSSFDKYEKMVTNKPGASTVIMNYKVENPSKYVIISESANLGKYQTYRFDKGSAAWSQIDISRHSGTAQTLFVDGHVDACNKEKLAATNLSGSGVGIWDGTAVSKL